MKNVYEIKKDTSRKKDETGYLRVAKCNISKAVVNEYLGSELQGIVSKQLEPGKIYKIYRSPEALKECAKGFTDVPLYDEHSKSLSEARVIGTISSDVEFDGKYLKASLTIWDEEAIALVESDRKTELSCDYRCSVTMTPGKSDDGEEYDGVITDMVANHVALVGVGRAGSDVRISDSAKKVSKMDEILNLIAGLKEKLKSDEEALSDEGVTAALADLVSEIKQDDNVSDEGAENGKTESKDEKSEVKDEEPEKLASSEAAKDDSKAGKENLSDSAVNALIAKAIEANNKSSRDARVAAIECRKVIGDTLSDSAEEIYSSALKKMGVNFDGVPASGLRALFGAVSKNIGRISDSAPKVGTVESECASRITKL